MSYTRIPKDPYLRNAAHYWTMTHGGWRLGGHNMDEYHEWMKAQGVLMPIKDPGTGRSSTDYIWLVDDASAMIFALRWGS